MNPSTSKILVAIVMFNLSLLSGAAFIAASLVNA